ncbi:MAG: hypothetical protein E7173_01085 [Firmicutes bacterium]|nr:hypothetical protein [Bacillota bacterium]
MTLNSVIYVDSLPKLDLHGLDRETARVLINDFIRDNKIMKNEIINIVHGRGSGVLRETTYQTLKANKNIVEFKSFYNNDGCTIAKIKI